MVVDATHDVSLPYSPNHYAVVTKGWQSLIIAADSARGVCFVMLLTFPVLCGYLYQLCKRLCFVCWLAGQFVCQQDVY